MRILNIVFTVHGMDYKTRSEYTFDELLNSLDGMQRASPGPYFFTRLQQKLTSGDHSLMGNLARLISRPVIAFGLLLFMIILNISILFNNESSVEKYDGNEDVYGYVSSLMYDEVR